MRFLIVNILFSGVLALFFSASLKEKTEYTLAFYNVENLFDTINDPLKMDEEFLPQGKYRWSSKRYQTKVRNLARVIEELGGGSGPDIIGICEAENKQVLQDVFSREGLAAGAYKVIQYNSSDRRGVDVALAYKSSVFKPFASRPYSVKSLKDVKWNTRDLLLVSGKISADTVHILVNHWTSRRGGQKETAPKRIILARLARKIVDSLQTSSPKAKIIIMGDFNDEPGDLSLSRYLGCTDQLPLKKGQIYNSFITLEKEGKGTVKFQKSWDMFDQIMISGGLLESSSLRYKDYSKGILDLDWMHYKNVKANVPFRTYQGSKYLGGFSDHLPVYIKLVGGHLSP
ncbi:MAG: endonuclease/exonuclease/phosphatase family protein [Cytophagaceae bacterium]